MAEEESVVHLDDLVVRRTDLWETPDLAVKLAPSLCSLFSWDDARRATELERLESALRQPHFAQPCCAT